MCSNSLEPVKAPVAGVAPWLLMLQDHTMETRFPFALGVLKALLLAHGFDSLVRVSRREVELYQYNDVSTRADTPTSTSE